VGPLACVLVFCAAGSLAVAGTSAPFRDEHAEDDSKIVVINPSHVLLGIRIVIGKAINMPLGKAKRIVRHRLVVD
jgi:hypothetical protein